MISRIVVKILNSIGNYVLKIGLKSYKKSSTIMSKGMFDWIYSGEGKMVFCWKYSANTLIAMLHFHTMTRRFEELFCDWDMVSK